MSRDNDPRFYETSSSARPRNRLDRFWTHPWMTGELIKHVGKHIPPYVWEPAAGRGDMSAALIDWGLNVHSSDIDISEFPTNYGTSHEHSFLDEIKLPETSVPYHYGFYKQTVKAIITNPPYGGLTSKFIRHGLKFMNVGEIEFMAMLLRSEFCNGKTREDMFGDCQHYMGQLVLTTRPRWDYGDPNAPKTAAPRHNFSWFLWSKDWSQRYDRPIQLFSYMPKGFKS